MATGSRPVAETVVRFYHDVHGRLLKTPDQGEVVAYARDAFAFAEAAIDAMREHLEAVAKDDRDGDSNLDHVFVYFEHLNRHLGMMEAIRGLQGVSGTATR